MPMDFNGTWNLFSSDNFENYLLALGIDFATRKIAKMLKPQKVIKQEGDTFSIHTSSTFRSYFVQFKIGEEFEEDNKGLDNRKCKSVVTWDNDKLVCVQSGDKKNRGWTHWIEGDELYLMSGEMHPMNSKENAAASLLHMSLGSCSSCCLATRDQKILWSTKQAATTMGILLLLRSNLDNKLQNLPFKHPKAHSTTILYLLSP